MSSTTDRNPSHQSAEPVARLLVNLAQEALRAVGIAYVGLAVVFASGVVVWEAGWARSTSAVLAALFAFAGASYWSLHPSGLFRAGAPDKPPQELVADAAVLVAASSIVAVWGISIALLLVIVDLVPADEPQSPLLTAIGAAAVCALALLFTRFAIRTQRAAGLARFPFVSIGPVFPFGPVPDTGSALPELSEVRRLLEERVPQVDALINKRLAAAHGRTGEEVDRLLEDVARLHAEKVGLIYFGQDFIIGPSRSDLTRSISFKVPLLLVPIAAAAYAPLAPLFYIQRSSAESHRLRTAQGFRRFRDDPFDLPWLPDFPLGDMRKEFDRSRNEAPDVAQTRLRQSLLDWAPGSTLGLEAPTVLMDRIDSWLEPRD